MNIWTYEQTKVNVKITFTICIFTSLNFELLAFWIVQCSAAPHARHHTTTLEQQFEIMFDERQAKQRAMSNIVNKASAMAPTTSTLHSTAKFAAMMTLLAVI